MTWPANNLTHYPSPLSIPTPTTYFGSWEIQNRSTLNERSQYKKPPLSGDFYFYRLSQLYGLAHQKRP